MVERERPGALFDGPWIHTARGLAVALLEPTHHMIDPLDVIWALANLCRYTGHARRFYSVAEHSIHVAQLAASYAIDPFNAIMWAWQGLWHDAAEAYVGDVSSPLKSLLPAYKPIEARLTAAIAQRLQLPSIFVPAVKEADFRMLATEAPQVLDWPPPKPWGPMPPPAEVRLRFWTPEQAAINLYLYARDLGLRAGTIKPDEWPAWNEWLATRCTRWDPPEPRWELTL